MIKGYPRPHLRLIQGGLNCNTQVGGVEVLAAPDGRAPFRVEGFVFEEDTCLMLSMAGKGSRASRDQLSGFSGLCGSDFEPCLPGSVIVRGKYPYRLFAIVHDLSCEPSWRMRWIRAALDNLMLEVDRLELRSLALPLLGSVHGQMDIERFLIMLHQSLLAMPPKFLHRIWLMTATEVCGTVIKELEAIKERGF